MNTSQRDDGDSDAQKRAVSACATVRDVDKRRSSSRSALNCADPMAGGGGGRNALPDGMTHVLQLGAVGSKGSCTLRGGVGRQALRPVGIVPDQSASDPSARARATTAAPTARPMAYPASTSLRNATPAVMRASPASRANA